MTSDTTDFLTATAVAGGTGACLDPGQPVGQQLPGLDAHPGTGMIHLGDGAQADQVVDEAQQFDEVHARYRAGRPGAGEAAEGVVVGGYTGA